MDRRDLPKSMETDIFPSSGGGDGTLGIGGGDMRWLIERWE